jgi:DNA-binding NarL/FixJ family response regulator
VSSVIRVLIAEDDGVLRRTIAELLRLESDMEVVAEAGDGQEAAGQAAILKPDIVLTDIDMPRASGIELTRQLAKIIPDTKVVILTKFGDDENVFNAIKAGAVGYVLKDAGMDEIARVIRSAFEGGGFLSPSLVTSVMGEFSRLSMSAVHNRKLFAELSRREVEVLECLAEGMKNSQIADRLCLSEKTVKSHVGAILRKLHVNDRVEAAMLAKDSGIG